MNIGIRLHDMAPGTLGERTLTAKQQGFTCAHLALAKTVGPELMAPGAATPGLASALTGMMNGLDVAVLGCYLNLTHPDGKTHALNLRKYKAHMQLGRWMNAGVVGTETPMPDYDERRVHTREMLEMYIRRLSPVVECAERFGVTMAIEPVSHHIVHDGPTARYVLDCIASDNLKIILDPVNLLRMQNLDRREHVIGEAIDLLGDDVMVVHMKDYYDHDAQGLLRPCACGTGQMDYNAVLRFIKREKPHVHITLENTTPENAVQARQHLEALAQTL